MANTAHQIDEFAPLPWYVSGTLGAAIMISGITSIYNEITQSTQKFSDACNQAYEELLSGDETTHPAQRMSGAGIVYRVTIPNQDVSNLVTWGTSSCDIILP